MENHRNRKKPRYGRKFKASDANRLDSALQHHVETAPSEAATSEALAPNVGVVGQELLLASFRKKDPAGLGESAGAPTNAQDIRDLYAPEPEKASSAFFTAEFLDEIDATAARAKRRIKARSGRRERPLPPESLELFVDDLG